MGAATVTRPSTVEAWPYPGDSPLVRARKVALAYRTALHTADPAACATVDAMMTRWGQRWVMPRVAFHEPDDWLTAAEAADLASVSVSAIRMMRRRQRLKGTLSGGEWRYRAGDVLALSVQARTKNRHESGGDERTDPGAALPGL